MGVGDVPAVERAGLRVDQCRCSPGCILLQPGSLANARPGSFAGRILLQRAVHQHDRVRRAGAGDAVCQFADHGRGDREPGDRGVGDRVGVRADQPAAGAGDVRAACGRSGVYDGKPTLFIRIGNERSTQILAAEVQVTVLRYQDDCGGRGVSGDSTTSKLSRSRTPIFALTFTVMHTIDENESALSGRRRTSMMRSTTPNV